MMSLIPKHLELINYWRGITFMAWASMLITAIGSPATAVEPAQVWKAVSARPFVLRGSERRLLDRAERFFADEQWDDAVTALMRLLELDEFSLVAISDQRYVSLSEYCQRLLVQLPPEPLARYRALVDATAESLYRLGIDGRDQKLLQRVVDNYFCSRWGDEALFAIGELALQRGEYRTARDAWLRVRGKKDSGDDRLIYPDTDLSLAAVQARLALVSIRAGDWRTAETELMTLKADYPGAQGRLGGREVVFADQLEILRQQAHKWPSPPTSNDWSTFAATAQRTNSLAAPKSVGPYELVWSQPMANEQLSSFPVVVNDLVLYQDDTSVHGLRLSDGEEAFWAHGSAFRSPTLTSRWIGKRRYTLTATDRYLFGVTTRLLGPHRKSAATADQSTLWSLDLPRDGALALHHMSEDPGVAFVGAPLVDGMQLFVPIRSNDQTARAGIACYDVNSGERSWQRWLCQANTPATGWTNEIASNLLAYDTGVIYASTNLGAVASVRAEDGQILWLRTYERRNAELDSDGYCAYYRGASPCVYHRGTVFVLPTDGSSLLALDATTGTELWNYTVTDDAAQLVGVTDERVILANNGLQVVERDSGKLAGENTNALQVGWPAMHIRGLHSEIYLPREDRINSFDVRTAETQFDGFELSESRGANLALAGDYLIAAGPSKLSVYRNLGRASSSLSESQTTTKE